MKDDEAFLFGPYRLYPSRRVLYRGDEEVPLGGRAFDILVRLVESAGKIVTRGQLIEHVWPDVLVEEANLRVHIARLRKALRDGSEGQRYIENITRRGYSFVASVHHERAVHAEVINPQVPTTSVAVSSNLPPALGRIIGREVIVAELIQLLRAKRFVSVVGAGGIGKTTVALSVAHAMLEEFDQAVTFVDLGALSSGELIDVAVATALGVVLQGENVLSGLIAFLQNRRVLIVLDNCEHVIESASILAERLFVEVPQLFILTTSREALRVEGENVYLLAALNCPPPGAHLTADDALTWPAIQLFMERAAARGHRFELTNDDAPVISSICTQLDGIALAIELAAGRVGTYGIRGAADLLSHRFKLLWQGRRSAPPRHQTMNAMLDWSYNLLSVPDQLVLARLSVFVGTFTLSAAQHIASDAQTSLLQVADSLTSLADKSLISTSIVRGEARYRLLEVTRSYAATKLEDNGEYSKIAYRHALYYSNELAGPASHAILDRDGADPDTTALVGNIRSALAWSFADPAHDTMAAELAARSVPLFLKLSLLRECGRWCERAIATIEMTAPDTAMELALREGLAVSAMFTRGNRDEIQSAITRGLAVAKALGSDEHALRLLSGLHIFKARIGDFRGLMDASERAARIAERLARDDALAMADWMLGTAYHLVGDQLKAQRHCEAGLRRSAAIGRSYLGAFGYDHRIRGLIVLARVLWLRGFSDQAASIASQVIAEAKRGQQPVALCIAWIYTATISIWSEDFETAEERIDGLIACATSHSLEPYRAVGVALRGEVAVCRGDLAHGIADLRSALTVLEAERHRILSTGFHRALAEALAVDNQEVEALTILDRTAARAEATGEVYQLPDLHRARGQILALGGLSDPETAEHHLRRSIVYAREQSSLGWELRTGSSLARLLLNLGRRAEAAALLEQILGAFSEGFDQPNMRSAAALLAQIKARG